MRLPKIGSRNPLVNILAAMLFIVGASVVIFAVTRRSIEEPVLVEYDESHLVLSFDKKKWGTIWGAAGPHSPIYTINYRISLSGPGPVYENPECQGGLSWESEDYTGSVRFEKKTQQVLVDLFQKETLAPHPANGPHKIKQVMKANTEFHL